jgi:hypothetical protein
VVNLKIYSKDSVSQRAIRRLMDRLTVKQFRMRPGWTKLEVIVLGIILVILLVGVGGLYWLNVNYYFADINKQRVMGNGSTDIRSGNSEKIRTR